MKRVLQVLAALFPTSFLCYDYSAQYKIYFQDFFPTSMSQLQVLATGTRGRVGSEITSQLNERYKLRTYDLEANPEVEDAIAGDISDFDALKNAMKGCDAVLHLAATSDEAPFREELLPNNIVGIYNVLEAAHQSGVKRVVFASSVQAIGGNLHRSDPNKPALQEDEIARPTSLYGASKVWGETLGRYYYDKYQLEFVSLRIGAFQPYDSDWLQRDICRDIWLSPRDMFQISWRALETPDVGYAVVHATSDVPREAMSLDSARRILGYAPEDKSDDFYAPRKEK